MPPRRHQQRRSPLRIDVEVRDLRMAAQEQQQRALRLQSAHPGFTRIPREQRRFEPEENRRAGQVGEIRSRRGQAALQAAGAGGGLQRQDFLRLIQDPPAGEGDPPQPRQVDGENGADRQSRQPADPQRPDFPA